MGHERKTMNFMQLWIRSFYHLLFLTQLLKASNSSSLKKVAVVTGSNKSIGYATVKGLCQNFSGDVFLTARDEGRGLAAVKKVAIVTGSNKGIGYATVKGLCQNFSGDVFLTARDESRGLAAVKSLNELGVYPKFHQLDITVNESIVKFKNFLIQEYGGVDVLVNNAAIAFKVAATEPMSIQAKETIRVNYFGTRNVCDVLFPILRPHARVVNLSSWLGLLFKIPSKSIRKKLSADDITIGQLDELMNDFVKSAESDKDVDLYWGQSSYTVSKVGVSALTRIQQREFLKDQRADIVVNSVHPGYVDTDMTSHKGSLTIEQGAVSSLYAALLPENCTEPKGAFIFDRLDCPPRLATCFIPPTEIIP